MIVVRASGHLFDSQARYPAWELPWAKLKHCIQNLNIGGVILLGGSAAEISLRTVELQSKAQTPLLIAADVEEGVGQRFSGATWFPPPLALGAIAAEDLELATCYAEIMGLITAREALAIGINWLLAPVVDVNNNPLNPVINVRAFGETPDLVSFLTKAFILGASSVPVLTTAKHFPGHGDTETDSHLNLPILNHSVSRLEAIELAPFRAAIAQKVDAIMTAHVLIPSLDEQYPATLSYKILTEQLRENLGFEGLIVTDALIMGGITSYASGGEIAVRAIEAGADILLMPPDAEVTINAIEEAVLQGRLSPSRIEESCDRIKKAKIKATQSQTTNFQQQLSQPKAINTVELILKDSTQVSGELPLKPESDGVNLIVVDNLLKCEFLYANCPAVSLPDRIGYTLKLIDSSWLLSETEMLKPFILQIFSRGNPFKGTTALTSQQQQSYLKLAASPYFRAIVVYGNPYIWQWFEPNLPPLLPKIFSFAQMPQAQDFVLRHLINLSRFDNLTKGIFL